MNKETELAWGFASAIIVLLITLIFNNINERHKTKRDKRLQLRYEMFGICHSIILNALNSSIWVLESRYRYAIFKNTGDDIEKNEYHRYASEGEKFSLDGSKELSKLISMLGFFETYWDVPFEVSTVKSLILVMDNKLRPTLSFEGLFNENMTLAEINTVYESQKSKIRNFILTATYAQSLLKVMEILDPKLKQSLFKGII